MSIQFACPNCGRQLRVPDSTVGQQSQCPKCQHVSEVSELFERVPDTDSTKSLNPYQSPSEPCLAVIDKTSRNWAMAGHLLSLSGAVIPFGNLLGPLVVWLMKRDELPFVADQAKEALNFQISVTAGVIVVGLVGVLTCGIGFVLIPVLLIAGFVLPIIAGIKASDGIAYRYPFTIRLVR